MHRKAKREKEKMNRKRRTARGGEVKKGEGEGVYEVKRKREGREERRKVCRDHTGRQFEVLTDRRGVDNPGKEKRFQVIYNRRSVRYGVRRRVKVEVGERERVPTVTERYKGGNWLERERWDMMGVGVEGHPDRRRILTDYGFEGHPLRKEFPLTGYKERRYDEGRKRVVREEKEMVQEMRQGKE